MFTIDLDTRVSWFRPCSLEPLYKFELLGLLVSLAVYNGAALPLNFPKAFYRKLLGLPVTTLKHIEDGWPALAKSFQDLLNWHEGDVQDVFMRTYEFSFETWGKRVDVDMERTPSDAPWPTEHSRQPRVKQVTQLNGHKEPGETATVDEPAQPHDHTGEGIKSVAVDPPNLAGGCQEAGMVTNDNRAQYVSDYIFWLTDKSIRPQYEAFARGFFTCLDKKALSVR